MTSSVLGLALKGNICGRTTPPPIFCGLSLNTLRGKDGGTLCPPPPTGSGVDKKPRLNRVKISILLYKKKLRGNVLPLFSLRVGDREWQRLRFEIRGIRRHGFI